MIDIIFNRPAVEAIFMIVPPCPPAFLFMSLKPMYVPCITPFYDK